MLEYIFGAKNVWLILSVWLMLYSHASAGNPDYPWLSLTLAVLAGLIMPTFRCCDHS